MATSLKNLSTFTGDIPSAKDYKFGIVVSEWNAEITESLFEGAFNTIVQMEGKQKNIQRVNVPGSFELTSGAQILAETKKFDAIICLGCVIQGETRHFDFICDAVANGITNVSIRYNIPVIFGVLTTDNLKQAQARAGGNHGNKGVEAAVTAIKMVQLSKSFKK